MELIGKIFRKKIKIHEVSQGSLPGHVAIIMDGNGRWARKRVLPRSAGHRAGSQTLKRIVEFSNSLGIKYLTVYAFSTENWTRPKEEVDALMNLLIEYLRQAGKELQDKNIKIRVFGDIYALPVEIQQEIVSVENMTRQRTGMVLNIALNYGSRNEIINAVKQTAREVKAGIIDVNDINEEYFSSWLYTAGMPDPDLVIRPSGEQRLSNFLLWQASYSEFWYSNILWPDFTEKDLVKAIEDYQRRDRRFGGI